MLHVRLVVPSDLSDDIEAILDDDAVVNIVWHHDVVRRPPGDLVTFDLVPEAANRVVNELRDARVDEEGSIMIDRVATSLSRTAPIAIALNPGDPSESVLWEEVKERVTADSTLTMTWLALVVVAVQIAAVGLLTDSAILMVGAMAVGPDFGPVASIAIGCHTRRMGWVRRGAVDLAVGYGTAVPVTMALAWVVEAMSRTPGNFLDGTAHQTGFVAHPGVLSAAVACLAGVAGMLSLTLDKSAALVGVFISVTTVPAAAGIGVFAAHSNYAQAAGSAVQLLVNVVCLVAAGVVTLAVQRRVFRRNSERQRLAALLLSRRHFPGARRRRQRSSGV